MFIYKLAEFLIKLTISYESCRENQFVSQLMRLLYLGQTYINTPHLNSLFVLLSVFACSTLKSLVTLLDVSI